MIAACVTLFVGLADAHGIEVCWPVRFSTMQECAAQRRRWVELNKAAKYPERYPGPDWTCRADPAAPVS